MKTSLSNMMKSTFLAATILATGSVAWAGQAPGALSAPDIPISHHDRVYAAEQFSNTVSVIVETPSRPVASAIHCACRSVGKPG